MPNVIWTIQARANPGRSAEAVALNLELAQACRDAGASSARVFSSNAGPAAPSIVLAMEFTGMANLEEVAEKWVADPRVQAVRSNTDPPTTILAQALAREVEG